MKTKFQEMAQNIVGQLEWLEAEYKAATVDAFQILLLHDPDTAKLALRAFDDPTEAAVWFGDRIESLGNTKPWEQISEGRTEWVQKSLSAIIYGLPM